MEQLLENLETQTDIVKSLLEEGDHADYLDFITAGDSVHRPLLLDFGTSNTCTMFLDGFTDAEADALNKSLQTLRDEANAETSLANNAKRNMPSRDDVPNIRRPWTFDDVELVVAGRKLGLNNDQIGNKLGRTGRSVEAVVTQLRREGRL